MEHYKKLHQKITERKARSKHNSPQFNSNRFILEAEDFSLLNSIYEDGEGGGFPMKEAPEVPRNKNINVRVEDQVLS